MIPLTKFTSTSISTWLFPVGRTAMFLVMKNAIRNTINDDTMIIRDVDRSNVTGKPKTSIVHNGVPCSIFSPLSLRQFFNRSEEHTSELQSRGHLVCRLL